MSGHSRGYEVLVKMREFFGDDKNGYIPRNAGAYDENWNVVGVHSKRAVAWGLAAAIDKCGGRGKNAMTDKIWAGAAIEKWFKDRGMDRLSWLWDGMNQKDEVLQMLDGAIGIAERGEITTKEGELR